MGQIFCAYKILFTLMTNYIKLESRIRTAVRQVSGTMKDEDDELLPEVAVVCKGSVFCFLPTNRSFIMIACCTKAVLISDQKNEAGRIVIYTFSGQLVEIEERHIMITGAD